MQQQQQQFQCVMSIGGMGSANIRGTSKGGLTLDHVLSRVQGELQKSRETGAELHNLTRAMNAHDPLGGFIVCIFSTS